MFRKSALATSLILVLFVLLTFAFGQALAGPATEAGPTPVWEEGRLVGADSPHADLALPAVATAPGTYYRTFSGTRFQPTGSALTYAPVGGAIHATALPAGGYSFSLDLDLPNGASITEVVFFVVDNDATNIGLSLRSYDPEANDFRVLESALSSGASAALQTIVMPVSPPVQVDNTTKSYRLRVAPAVGTSAHLLRGARIGFTVPSALLPMITK